MALARTGPGMAVWHPACPARVCCGTARTIGTAAVRPSPLPSKALGPVRRVLLQHDARRGAFNRFTAGFFCGSTGNAVREAFRRHQSPVLALCPRFASTVAVMGAPPAERRGEPLPPRSEAVPAQNIEETRSEPKDSTTSRPGVAYHLFFCAALVYLIIVVGGLTRLTESGLSITEWNPGFKGMRMPWTDEEWNHEWEKYKRTPEWAVLNQHMTVDDFKSIYMWEWSHRIIGRFIGVAFVLPAMYFLARGRIARGSRWKIWAIAAGIGFQGALGWFMVRSGLTAPEATPPAVAPSHPNATTPAGKLDPRVDGSVSAAGEASPSADWHPRVSHFRLAAHLGTAFAVYLGMLHTGMSILREHKVATRSGKVGGLRMRSAGTFERLVLALQSPRVGRFRTASRAMLVLTFVTAMSGALVAGLDAGLVYSEFPYMGEGLVPPREELLDDRYTWGGRESAKQAYSSNTAEAAKERPSSRLILGNVSQNPVTVQLVHRCLAMTTLASALALGFYGRRLSRSMALVQQQRFTLRDRAGTAAILPPVVPRLALGVAGMASLQATLGISTLIYLVPIQLASAHQAGSVALLSVVIALLVSLRRPSVAAQMLAARAGAQTAAAPQERAAVVTRTLRRVTKA